MSDARTQPMLTQERIRRRIRAMLGRQYLPGQRLPPVKTLARMLHTGQTNTLRAIQSLVAEGLLVARPSVGTIVCDGVSPAESMPALTGAVDRRVVILHATSDPMVTRTGDSIRRSLSHAGARCTTIAFTPTNFRQRWAEHHHADAAVLINPPWHGEPIRTAPGQAMLVLSAAAEIPVGHDSSFDYIGVDSRQGGWLAGSHLRDLKMKSACFVGVKQKDRDAYDATSTTRLAGFEEGFASVVPREQRLVSSSYAPTGGARAAAEYAHLPHRPHAVFCASDEIATGFLMGAHALGLEVLRDYQLVGFDGQIRGRELIEGPLTTVDIPLKQMASLGVQWLIERLAELDRPTRRLMMGCRLFQGATTRPPAQ